MSGLGSWVGVVIAVVDDTAAGVDGGGDTVRLP